MTTTGNTATTGRVMVFGLMLAALMVASLLGHSSITQTMDTYSHLLDDVDDDEVGSLDEAFG